MRLLPLILLLLPVTAPGSDHYHATFSDDLRQVTVRACFAGKPPRYLYRNPSADSYTEWIRNDDGTERRKNGGQRLNPGSEPCLRWRVDLGRAADEGNYRVAFRSGSDTVASTDLWFWRDDERREIRVEAKLPAGAELSVPWTQIITDEGRRVYRPERTPASWSSRFAVGRYGVDEIKLGGSVLRLAAVGPIEAGQRHQLSGWIRQTAESVATVYGEFPQQAAQILIVAIGKRNEPVPWAHVLRGGGVAAVFYIDETRPIGEFTEDWTATHELSHILLPYVSTRDRWFSEGLASYYQNVLRARDGRLTELQAWRKLHAGFERGKRAVNGDSLARATRGGWGATMRVYWSGAAMMLKADTLLRARSGGRQSLDSALRGLQVCCFGEGAYWSARELFEELDRQTNLDVFMTLYDAHVMDSDFPSVDETFAQLGVVVQPGGVRLDHEAPWGDIRLAIMGGREAASVTSAP